MNEEVDIVEEQEEPQFVPASKWERALYAVVTIVMPILSFIIAYNGILSPDWQDGRISSYAAIMLEGMVARYFYPFLLYAVIALGLLLIDPKRFSKSLPVRLGIYTGAILALQYAITISVFFDGIAAAIGIIGGAMLYFGTCFLHHKIGVGKTALIYFGLLLIAYMIFWGTPDLNGITLFGIIFLFLAAPFATLVIGILTSWKLSRKYPLAQNEYRGLVAWLAGYALTWRAAILKTVDVYNALPPSPPNHCYIATAAAKGHPQFVRSTPLHAEDGQIVRVNAQLRYLKLGEIALTVITPRFHHLLRKVYDILGKALARRIVHPILADMAYLALKPFEWSARLLLKPLFPDIDLLAEKIYRGQK